MRLGPSFSSFVVLVQQKRKRCRGAIFESVDCQDISKSIDLRDFIIGIQKMTSESMLSKFFPSFQCNSVANDKPPSVVFPLYTAR